MFLYVGERERDYVTHLFVHYNNLLIKHVNLLDYIPNIPMVRLVLMSFLAYLDFLKTKTILLLRINYILISVDNHIVNLNKLHYILVRSCYKLQVTKLNKE